MLKATSFNPPEYKEIKEERKDGAVGVVQGFNYYRYKSTPQYLDIDVMAELFNKELVKGAELSSQIGQAHANLKRQEQLHGGRRSQIKTGFHRTEISL